MCGMFGIWQFDGRPLDCAAVQRGTNILRHRGPDDEGYLLVNTETGRTVSCAGRDTDPRLNLRRIESFSGDCFDLALGFRRLSVLDPSPAGHQPMATADGRSWILHNGEMFNHSDLRVELSRYGYDFHTGTDTEVILAAYQRWGYECLSRFNGMWAFVLWDATQRHLFIARDRFGIKPLYYVADKHKIAFASEIKALVGSGLVRFQPNDEAVYRYLVAGWLPSPPTGDTFFQRVRLLPAGHWLAVTDQGLKKSRYWTLDSSAEERRELGAPEAVERYRQLFTDAVGIRLGADVPVGSCLSGGVDSSSIVCVINQLMRQGGLAREQIGRRQRTFSAVYDTAGPYNETQHIEKVLQATGAEGNFVFPGVERLRAEVARLVWHQDEPFQSTSIFAQWCVMKDVHHRGVTVLLDGQGADELLGGYRPFSVFLGDLIGQGRFLRALAEARAIRGSTGTATWRLLSNSLMQQLPHRWMDPVRRQLIMWRTDWSVLNPAFAAHWKQQPIADWQPSRSNQNLQSHLRDLVEESSLPHLLRFEDRNSMAHSIEARVPYLDYRLVELSFHDVARWRIHQGWTKWVLRKAMERIVPHDIIWRKDKVGFETPERAWLAGWMGAESDFFGSDSLSRDYLDIDVVRTKAALWTSDSGDKPDLPLWRWVNLELWLRCFAA